MMTCRICENLLLLGLGCGIFATLFHNMFTVTLRFAPSAFILWTFLGVAAGYAFSQRVRRDQNASKLAVTTIILLMLASAPFLYMQSVRYYVGDHLIESSRHIRGSLPKDASVTEARAVMETSLAALHKGNRFAPFHIKGYWDRAHIYNSSVTDYVQAYNMYVHVEELNASFTSCLYNLCVNAMQQAKQLRERSEYFEPLAQQCFQDAKQWAMKAIEYDPLEPEHHYHLGRCLRELQKLDEAKVALNHAIELIPYMQVQDQKISIQDCQDELKIIQLIEEHQAANLK